MAVIELKHNFVHLNVGQNARKFISILRDNMTHSKIYEQMQQEAEVMERKLREIENILRA